MLKTISEDKIRNLTLACFQILFLVGSFVIATSSKAETAIVTKTEAATQTATATKTENLKKTSALSHHELWLGHWFEAGVTDRLLTDYFTTLQLNSILSLEMGFSFSLFHQPGPSLIGFLGKASFPKAKSLLVLGVQYERWPNWRMTENRAELYWKFLPHPHLNVSFGFAYRTPQTGTDISVPFSNWSSHPDGEINLLYAFDWILFEFQPVNISLMVWDYDHMRLFSMDNIHFTLKGDWLMPPSLKFTLAATAGVQGVSGGILSWDQSIVSAGISYDL